MSIAPDLAKSLSEKSDQELIGILESPADWKPEVIDFARSELGRRSISTAQIDQKLADSTKQKAEEFQKRSTEPLSFWETVFTALYGGGLGLLGLIFVWPQASRFKSSGFLLKSKKSWHIYWHVSRQVDTLNDSSSDTIKGKFLKRRIIHFVWLAVSFRPQYLIELNVCIALLFRQ
ncbi:MAG: hypothetical protein ABSD57_07400 [Verrucomicrobiota bacterium]|jgi:hypothetical protein